MTDKPYDPTAAGIGPLKKGDKVAFESADGELITGELDCDWTPGDVVRVSSILNPYEPIFRGISYAMRAYGNVMEAELLDRRPYYSPYTVPVEPGDRDDRDDRTYLIHKGFDPDEVDKFLTERAEREAERERVQAEREAYERTRRYRIVKAWGGAKTRMALAWSVLRGNHECNEEDW